jgi:hypothetical protein
MQPVKAVFPTLCPSADNDSIAISRLKKKIFRREIYFSRRKTLVSRREISDLPAPLSGLRGHKFYLTASAAELGTGPNPFSRRQTN